MEIKDMTIICPDQREGEIASQLTRIEEERKDPIWKHHENSTV